MVLGFFKIALRFRVRHVFMRQSLKILNMFNTFKQFYEKRNENFFQDTGVLAFYLKASRLKTQDFHTKLLCQKQMLRQIKWGEQNGPITDNGVLPVNTSFFENFVSV